MRLILLLALVAVATAQCVANNNTDGGTGQGDVHYTTLDGRYFDYQGIGKYVFARVDGEIEVQTCLAPWGYEGGFDTSVSINKAVAVRVGTAVVYFSFSGYSVSGTAVLLSNDSSSGSIANLVYQAGSVTFGLAVSLGTPTPYSEFGGIVSFPSGASLRVNVYDSFINVGFLPVTAYVNRTKGLVGLFDCDQSNDFTKRDGSVSSSSDDFSLSWKLVAGEDLFPADLECPDSLPTHIVTNGTFVEPPQEFAEQADACCSEQGVFFSDSEVQDPKAVRCRFDVAVAAQDQARRHVNVESIKPQLVDSENGDGEFVNEASSCPDSQMAKQLENLPNPCVDDCSNRGFCDLVQGQCVCFNGWSGEGCEVPPPCNCPNGFTCNPASGFCVQNVQASAGSASFVGSNACQALGVISVSAPNKFGCCFLSYQSEIGCIQQCPDGASPEYNVCWQDTCVQGCLSSNSPVKYLQLCENCPDVDPTQITETPIVV